MIYLNSKQINVTKFQDGTLLVEQTLSEIRARLANG